MSAVSLTVTRGNLKGQTFDFAEPTQCLIGRASDCTIQLPREPGRLDASRHHCLVEIEDDGVRVRDLGSLHGTFVNGRLIGQRPPDQPAEYISTRDLPSVALKSGDQLQVGGVVFHIGIRQTSRQLQGKDSWCIIV